MKKDKNRDAAQDILQRLNTLSLNCNNIIKGLMQSDEDSQRKFTRLCLEWLITCASDSYGYDLRNEGSKEVAEMLLKDKDVDAIIMLLQEEEPKQLPCINAHGLDFKDVFTAFYHNDINTKEMARWMAREHRTLQQNFTRLCATWFVACTSKNTEICDSNSREAISALLDGKNAEDLFAMLPFI